MRPKEAIILTLITMFLAGAFIPDPRFWAPAGIIMASGVMIADRIIPKGWPEEDA